MEIWPPSDATLSVQEDAAAGRSSAAKRAEIAEWLTARKADAVVLSALDSIAWAFNIRGSDVSHTPVALAYAIVNADGTAAPRTKTLYFEYELATGKVTLNDSFDATAPIRIGGIDVSTALTILAELGPDPTGSGGIESTLPLLSTKRGYFLSPLSRCAYSRPLGCFSRISSAVGASEAHERAPIPRRLRLCHEHPVSPHDRRGVAALRFGTRGLPALPAGLLADALHRAPL